MKQNSSEPEDSAPLRPADGADDLPLVVGVDLGGTQIRAAVLQGARLLSRVGQLTGEDTSPERVIPRMIACVEQAIADAQTTLAQIAGIGIGSPGPLNSRTGVVFSPPNLQWRNVPLRDLFMEHFKLPVFVENDANAAALGEYMFGAGRGCSEMVYLTLSTGIGGGVIADGRILEGILGTAGELGHMTIDLHGPRCNCGNIGCLESLASGTAIARRANELIALGKGPALLEFALKQATAEERAASTPMRIDARTVALAAEAGVPVAKMIIGAAAEALGFGLVNIIHIFNPQLIILGGSLTQMGERLLGPAKRIVQAHTMSVPREAARITLAELGPDVGLVGAGALIHHYMTNA